MAVTVGGLFGTQLSYLFYVMVCWLDCNKCCLHLILKVFKLWSNRYFSILSLRWAILLRRIFFLDIQRLASDSCFWATVVLIFTFLDHKKIPYRRLLVRRNLSVRTQLNAVFLLALRPCCNFMAKNGCDIAVFTTK